MSGFFQVFELRQQRHRIHDGARPDHGFLARAQNPAGNQLQHVAMTIENNGVASVVAAGIARRVVKRRREVVDYLAFSFVAPLRADHRDCFRPGLLAHPQHPASKRPHLARSNSILKRYRRAYTAERQS